MVQVLDVLQGEGAGHDAHPNLGAGYILPSLHYLKEELQEFVTGQQPLKYCKPFALAILNSMDKR